MIGGPGTYPDPSAARAEDEGARAAAPNARARRHRRRVVRRVDDRAAVAASRRVDQPAQRRADPRFVTAPGTCRYAPSTTTSSREYRRAAATTAPSRRCARCSTTPCARTPAASSTATRSRGCGCPKSRGRATSSRPPRRRPRELIALADELTPPSFAAYLDVAIHEGARPGELDALRWDDGGPHPGARRSGSSGNGTPSAQDHAPKPA